MKHCILILSLFFFSLITHAQHQIEGQILDSDNNPIIYANAVLIDSETNNLYQGTISNETGFFSFKDIKTKQYILKISFIGYKTHTEILEINKSTTLPAIVLENDAEALDEITLVAKKPVVKQLVDRLVFKVENTTLSEGNAWDILKNTPSVIVHQDQITIRNSTNIIVLINDKRVHL